MVEPDHRGSEHGRRHQGLWKIVALVGVVAGLFVVFKFLPVGEYVIALLEWTRGLGIWGPIVVAGVYILACVLMAPGSVLTVGAGFLFGLVGGTITASVGSTLGACAAFLVGRTVARGWVEQKVVRRPKFKAIDRAVGREGFKIVLLTRLSPIFPFNLLNYAYGLTEVRFWSYALASWLGMLPGTVLFVYIGWSLAKVGTSLAEVKEGQSNPAISILFWGVGLVVLFALVFFVTRVARKALDEAVGKTGADDDDG